MKTLCCFRLVLEGKTGTRGKRDTRVAKIRVLGKVFSILFCFTRCRSQHLCLLNRGGIADLLRNLLAIRQNSRGPSDGLLCFSTICKFGSFKHPFASIASLPKLYFWIRRFVLKYLSNDHEDHPHQHENSLKLCDETEHPTLSLLESQWKLRQQHNQNFPMEGKSL